MPITIVVGGQFGSEGKGKVAHFLAREKGIRFAIRVGGTNSGHTVIDSDGEPIVLRQLPTASLLPNVICILPAGSYIDPFILAAETERVGLQPERLLIDPNAMVISSDDKQRERDGSLRDTIGSTASGTGAALQRRLTRTKIVKLAKDTEQLSPFIKSTVPYMRDRLSNGQRILIEGTQGYGLSLLHSDFYPYVTSRDTTAAVFVAESGLSPLDVDEVVLVIRAFPIRVDGHSGPLPKEIGWKEISQQAGREVIEYTSVTKAVRRVGLFDAQVVKDAIMSNQPTTIFLNHLDYLGEIYNGFYFPSKKIKDFVNNVEESINMPINYFGFGPNSVIKRDTFLKENVINCINSGKN